MNHHYSHICHLGHFNSLAEVWKKYPDGGCIGDCLCIGTHLYCWDPMRRNWLEDNYTDSDSFRLLRQTGDLDLFGNLRVGGSAFFQHHALFKGDVRIEGRLLCRHLQGHDKGLFISIEALQAAIPSPRCGDWALVADAGQLQLWQSPADGTWQQTPAPTGFLPTFNLEAYNNARNIVDSIAEHGYVFCGVAAPTTQPLRPTDHNIFYLTSQPGEYIHFGHMQVRELSVLMWTHDADPDGDGLAEGQWTSYVVSSSFASVAEDLRREMTEATTNMAATLRSEMADITASLGNQIREEIASVAEEAADAGHKVKVLAFMQSETPVLTSPGASALAGAMPHGVFWYNPSTGTLSSGYLNGAPPRMSWEEIELSEETLYVDRNGQKLYVWKDGEMTELPVMPESSPSQGEPTPEPGGEGEPEIIGPARFDRARGNLGAFTIEGDPEDITEQDVRDAYTVPLIDPAGNERIWTAAEVGLLEGDANATTNASLIRAAVADPTCYGIKLDKVYPVKVGNPGANAAISRVSDYNDGTKSIILPRNFVIDGEGTDENEGEAVGGFKILNTKGNLFYTESSLNLLYVRTETTRHATDNFFNYVVNCVQGVDQVQVIGCVFQDTTSVYRSIMIAFEDADPRGEDWVLPEENCLRHLYMADCVANGSLVLCNSGCMRVTDTFRIVGCEFTNMKNIGIHLATANDLRWENVMAYMCCPIYIAGCTFQGQQGVVRKSSNSPYGAVCIENSALYMLHNEISDFVSVPHRTGESSYRSPNYDAYFNGQQLYYCNNTVSNILSVDTVHSIDGIMKAKGNGLSESPMKRDLELEELTADNNRRRVRCWRNNTYTLDKTQVAAWWAAHLADNDGNEVEVDYEEAIVLDDALTITIDSMDSGTLPLDEYIVENNTFASDGNIQGYGSDYCPANKVSIKGNTFTAVRISSEEWGYKASSGAESEEWSYLFSVMLDNTYGDPEVYVEGNEFDVAGVSSENVHVLLFRTTQSSANRKPDLWPEDGKATFKGNQSLGSAASPLIVGFATWAVARNYGNDGSKSYNTLAHFDTTE